MDLEKLWKEKLEGRAWQVKEEFLSLLSYMIDKQVQNVLEIGAYKGGTALGFLSIGSDVTSIDIVKTPEVEELEESNDYFGFFYRDEFYAEEMDSNRWDMLFIDGDHSYEGCKKDYEEFSLYVKPSGLVVFHDVVKSDLHASQGCEVWKFLEELKGNEFTHFVTDGNWGGISVMVKK